MELVSTLELIFAGPCAKSAEWRTINASIIGALQPCCKQERDLAR